MHGFVGIVLEALKSERQFLNIHRTDMSNQKDELFGALKKATENLLEELLQRHCPVCGEDYPAHGHKPGSACAALDEINDQINDCK